MRFVSLFLVFLLSTTVSFAQESIEESVGSSQADVTAELPPSKNAKSNFRFSAFYELTTKAGYDQSFATATLREDMELGGNLGLGADYIYRKNNDLGFSAGVQYQLPKKIKSFSGSASNGFQYDFNYSESPSLSYIAPVLNANFTIEQNYYVFAGVNYNFPSYDKNGFTREITKGGLGYQIGLGANILSSLDAELAYQVLNMDYKLVEDTVDYSISGVALKAVYLFN